MESIKKRFQYKAKKPERAFLAQLSDLDKSSDTDRSSSPTSDDDDNKKKKPWPLLGGRSAQWFLHHGRRGQWCSCVSRWTCNTDAR